MAQSLHLREQAERCRRLARDCADLNLRDGLLKLADQYTGRAAVLEGQETPVRNAASEDAA